MWSLGAWKSVFFGAAIFLFAWIVVLHLWMSGPVEGTVTDTNGRPVAGAVVLAVWSARTPLSGMPKTVMLAEATTDAAGHFHMAGWGPRPSPGLLLRMEHMEPAIHVVHQDHLPIWTYSARWPEGGDARILVATPSGPLSLLLVPAQPPESSEVKQRVEHYTAHLLLYEYSGGRCIWSVVPHFRAAVSHLENRHAAAFRRFADLPTCP